MKLGRGIGDSKAERGNRETETERDRKREKKRKWKCAGRTPQVGYTLRRLCMRC